MSVFKKLVLSLLVGLVASFVPSQHRIPVTRKIRIPPRFHRDITLKDSADSVQKITEIWNGDQDALETGETGLEEPLPLEDIVVQEAAELPGKVRYPRDPRLRTTLYDFVQAGTVGTVTGLAVVFFKICINRVRLTCYGPGGVANTALQQALIPTFGGLLVGALTLTGPFASGMREMVKNADKLTNGLRMDLRKRIGAQLAFNRKAMAAVFTLGTGCSLGPEGPCVEIGMDIARACMDLDPLQKKSKYHRPEWNRMLLSCGAAAGVAAGFNAPIAGVFFSLEILKRIFDDVDKEDRLKGRSAFMFRDISSAALVTPLLLSSVLAASTAHFFMGDHQVLHLTDYTMRSPVVELPLFALLGALSGCVAVLFNKSKSVSADVFKRMTLVPQALKPVLGGLLCGLVALRFPQILFFGYSILDPLLSNTPLPSFHLLNLLLVKMICTAASSGSGLIGGTFAPSLVLGAVTGGFFHNSATYIVKVLGLSTVLAHVPAYAMVGSASVLGALFRAPLTATLLVFEATRDYNVILPLMASSGIATALAEVIDTKLLRRRERRASR